MTLTITRPAPRKRPALSFQAAEGNARYGLTATLLGSAREGEIDPEVNRVLLLTRTLAAFKDDELNRAQVTLTFTPADEEGMDLPLLDEAGDEQPAKRIVLNYAASLAVEADSDQFEFARWLSEYKTFARVNGLLGRLELVVYYGEDPELLLDTALARIEWLLADGHLRLTQPYALALGY